MDEVGARRVAVVGVAVACLSMAEIVETVVGWTESPGVKVAIGVNASVCNLAARDESFREQVRESDLAYADGQAIVWAARALGAPIPERTATTDLVYPLVRDLAGRSRRIFLFGGAAGIAHSAGLKLVEHAPGLSFRSHQGDLSPESMDTLLAELSDFEPDVLFVGLGDPLQQDWVAKYRQIIGVPVILTCGGLFDWVSGAHRRAPAWMINAGLEWLWRLALEPRRLAGRYLVGNPMFIARFGKQLIRLRFGGSGH